MSIKYKLLCILILVGAGAVLITGFFGYEMGKRGLTQTAMNQLTGIRRSKAYQIETYFRNVRSQVRTLRESRMVKDALHEFRDEVTKLNRTLAPPEIRDSIVQYYKNDYLPRLHKLVDPRVGFDEYLPTTPSAYYLQRAFISGNPLPTGSKQALAASEDVPGYSRVHSANHNSFRKIIQEFGYYDLFLIDAKSGQIIYSVAKEVDFATNLYTGPYKNSGLAKAAKQARDSQDGNAVSLADFEMYEPSYGAPAAFAASPIREGGEVIGILAVQVPNDEIDKVISGHRGWERDGLGRSGDSGIVGADYLLRSNARGFLQRREEALDQMRARGIPAATIERIRAYNSTVLQQQVRLPSVTAALAGEEGTRVQVGSAGRASLVSYMPLKIPGLHWTIASRIDLSEALAPVDQFRRSLIWWSLLTLALTSLLALALTRAILGPVNRLVTAAERVSESDLSVQIPITTKDELGRLTRTFNHMVASIREKTEIIEQKNRENERLLLNILPGPIAERLKGGETRIADNFAEVTVLFADIVGFTRLSSRTSPAEMVDLLNRLFTRFDACAQELGVEKIKTIGDAYMAVAGLPTPYEDHSHRMVKLALRMLEEVRDFSEETGAGLSVRIGINSGPAVAGVIGSTKFIYDLWGDTVNVASRMESHGVAGMIQVTRAVYEKLAGEFEFCERGEIEIKGKGVLETWLLCLPAYAGQSA
ncbi:MAG TPA: adenylate/guanylate cyclase domain-containing protein [Bryobacteraceae bacterium]|nr:adenylate/guanylate cyclase domain-containing protein [Bryobacteraceae bacterium]